MLKIGMGGVFELMMNLLIVIYIVLSLLVVLIVGVILCKKLVSK